MDGDVQAMIERATRLEETVSQLTAKVAVLERAASEDRLAIAARESIRRERRYALLQAAASIHVLHYATTPARHLFAQSVNDAERLLAEIQRRENRVGLGTEEAES